MAIEGLTFDQGSVEAVDDGNFYRSIVGADRIISGCTITATSTTIHVSSGLLNICGRNVKVNGAYSATISPTENANAARLYCMIDTSKAPGEQVAFFVDYAVSSGSFATLPKNDVNNEISVQYGASIAEFTLVNGGIVSNFPDLFEMPHSTSVSGTVHFDETQQLTESETTTARENISANTGNENLLDNWYFLDPINQFGETSWSSTGTRTYTIDRWISWGGALSIGANGFSIAALAGNSENNLTQFVKRQIKGKVVTLSAEIDGTIYSYTTTVPSTQTENTSDALVNGLKFAVGISSGDVVYARFTPTSETATVISRCKLEFGRVSTLIHDAPPNLAEQQIRCMRYLQNFAGEWQIGFTQDATNIRITYTLPVPMSASPTLRMKGSLSLPWVRCDGKQYSITNATITLQTTSAWVVIFNFAITGASLPTLQPALCPIGRNIFLTSEA